MAIRDIKDDTEFSHKVQESINDVILPELVKIFRKGSPALKKTARYIHTRAMSEHRERRTKKVQKK